MKTVIVAAVTAFIVAFIYGKISAIHTFNVIDSYVKETIDLIKKSIRDTYLNK